MSLDRILLPIDLARCPPEALHFVNRVIRRYDAEVILLYVMTLNIVAPESRVYAELAEEARQHLEKARRHLVLTEFFSMQLCLAAKRADVDKFVQQDWLPFFAKTALETPAVQRVFQQACRAESPTDRIEALVGLGTRLQAQLNQKRTELMQPLDQFEADLIRSVETAYSEMLAANATLTGLLQAHAETTATQAEIAKGLKIDDKLASSITEADKLVALLTAGREGFERNRGKIEEILNAVKRN